MVENNAPEEHINAILEELIRLNANTVVHSVDYHIEKVKKRERKGNQFVCVVYARVCLL